MNRAERLKKEIAEISGPNTSEDYQKMFGSPSDGESAERAALDILRHRVYDDVRGLAKDALQAVLDGHTDADDVGDYIHESVDGAICYTKDQYLYAFLLDDSDDFEDMGGMTDSWESSLAAKAFCNLKSEVEQMVSRCLDNADWETEDEEEEES